jgi:long-chain acyl-CoA synthetase
VFERGGRLAAVAVPNEEAARARGALREAAWLREQLDEIAARLPPYQRITSYRFVRAPLPRTQLGKLRRHLLPAVFEGSPQDNTADETTPWSAADRRLVDSPLGHSVWQWLVERYPDRSLTPDTSPQLDLEIDSLEWVGLTVEIEQRFRVALRSEQLGGILTLRDLLREIDSAPHTGASAAPPQSPFVAPGPFARAVGAVVFGAVRIAVRTALRPRVHGLECLPAGPALITPNHASYLDPLVLAAALPWRRLRRTYWAGWVGVMHSSRVRRWLSRATQVFPVDPDRDLNAALRTARALLEQGHTVVWFPEGRRSPTGELGEFQAGAGMLVANTTTPAVPVAIGGTYAAWPKHRRWPRIAPTSVTFGAPVAFAVGETASNIGATLQRSVAALLTPRPDSAASWTHSRASERRIRHGEHETRDGDASRRSPRNHSAHPPR